MNPESNPHDFDEADFQIGGSALTEGESLALQTLRDGLDELYDAPTPIVEMFGVAKDDGDGDIDEPTESGCSPELAERWAAVFDTNTGEDDDAGPLDDFPSDEESDTDVFDRENPAFKEDREADALRRLAEKMDQVDPAWRDGAMW